MKITITYEVNSIAEAIGIMFGGSDDVPTVTSTPDLHAGEGFDGPEQADPAPAPEPSRRLDTIAVNLYESQHESFALGARVFDNADEAVDTATAGCVGTACFKIDDNGTVPAAIHNRDSQVRWFAVKRDWDRYTMSRGYSSAQAVSQNESSSFAIVSIGYDGQRVTVSQ